MLILPHFFFARPVLLVLCRTRNKVFYGAVAQLAEHSAFNRQVVRSSLTGPTNNGPVAQLDKSNELLPRRFPVRAGAGSPLDNIAGMIYTLPPRSPSSREGRRVETVCTGEPCVKAPHPRLARPPL